MGLFRFVGRAVRGVPREVIAIWLAARHPSTPRGPALLALLAGLYAVSPFDLVPDFVVGLGWLDDLVLVPTLLALAARGVPPPVMAAARTRAEVLAAQPKKWLLVLLAVLLWLAFLLGLGLWWLLR